jgi:putative phosphonate catabolism associated alcohol dehydrogenase
MNIISNYPSGRVVVFHGHGKPFEFITNPVRDLKPGEILVQTKYTTLCGSDIHTYCGRRQEPPHVVLGHEIVGDILAIHPSHPGLDFNGQKIKVGDRLIWAIFAVPEEVTPPRADIPQKSNHLFKYGHVLAEDDDVFSGGLADYCILRSNTAVIKISNEVPLQVAATISCAHATVAGALRVAESVKGKKVLVFGVGMLGLSCMAMCKEAGAEWIGAVDTNVDRLSWAIQFGSSATFVMPDHASGSALPWQEVDVVFDMTGDSGAEKIGIDSLAVGGCAIWIGAVYPTKPVEIDAQKIVRKVLQIRGLHNYNYQDFANAASFIEKHLGGYPFEAAIEKEFTLEQIEEAFIYATEKKPVRVGIKISN